MQLIPSGVCVSAGAVLTDEVKKITGITFHKILQKGLIVWVTMLLPNGVSVSAGAGCDRALQHRNLFAIVSHRLSDKVSVVG